MTNPIKYTCEKSFQDYSKNFDNENHETKYFGWLCNDLPDFQFDKSIPATVFTRAGCQRPYIVPHEDFDHPFVRDYYDSITKKEAKRRINTMLKSIAKSERKSKSGKPWWKKVSFLFLFMAVNLVSCRDRSQPECSKFKTGTFLYYTHLEGMHMKVKVIRNDLVQTEIDTHTGDTFVLRIKWLDPCSYEMHYIKYSHSIPDSLSEMMHKLVIKSTILETTDKYYIFHTEANLNKLILQDTMWIAK